MCARDDVAPRNGFGRALAHELSLESGEAENDKGYESTSWIEIFDSRDALGTLTIIRSC